MMYNKSTIDDIKDFLQKSENNHYKLNGIEAFDVYKSLSFKDPLDSYQATLRNTAIKYLMRFGRKHGKNKEDLMKAMNYILKLYDDIEDV